ncbi:MAG: HD domain-containing protein [bacterium]
MNRILQATLFAAKKHTNQRRKDPSASPYINHPLEVAWILSSIGAIVDEDVLIAALLHDTIEDTQTTREEIEFAFGERVAGFVCECTDDKLLPKEERKRLQIENAPKKSNEAKCIKIADKIANLKSVMIAPPMDWSIDRQIDYLNWAGNVVAGLKGVNQSLDEEFELIWHDGSKKLQNG